MNFIDFVRMTPTVIRNIKSDNQKIELGKCKRLVLLGVGTSFNAAVLAKNLLEIDANFDKYVEAFTASEFYHFQNIDPNSMYIVISQSGKSEICNEVIEKLKKAKANYYSLTGDNNNPLVEKCDSKLVIPMEKETVAFKSLGYTATTFSILKWVGSKIVDELNPDQLEKDIVDIENKVQALVQSNPQLKTIKKVNLVGDGFTYPIAQEAQLKVIEMLNINANASETEDYLHGRYLDQVDCLNVIFTLKQEGTTKHIIDFWNERNSVLTIDVTKLINLKNDAVSVVHSIIFVQSLMKEINELMGMNPNDLSSRELVKNSKL